MKQYFVWLEELRLGEVFGRYQHQVDSRFRLRLDGFVLFLTILGLRADLRLVRTCLVRIQERTALIKA